MKNSRKNEVFINTLKKSVKEIVAVKDNYGAKDLVSKVIKSCKYDLNDVWDWMRTELEGKVPDWKNIAISRYGENYDNVALEDMIDEFGWIKLIEVLTGKHVTVVMKASGVKTKTKAQNGVTKKRRTIKSKKNRSAGSKCKGVIQYYNGKIIKEYSSQTVAAREIGINRCSLNKHLNGDPSYKTLKGYTFKSKVA